MKNNTLDQSEAFSGTLNQTEFVIRQGAKFIPSEGSKLQIKEDGTVTLTYKLANMNDLITEDNANVSFSVYGVFKKDSLENFVSGSIPEEIMLDTTAEEVIITSPNNEINVLTNGKKKESGQGITSSGATQLNA